MNTTLNEIRKHSPCSNGWNKLLHGLGKKAADNEPLPFLDILRINGLDDTTWALRVIKDKEVLLGILQDLLAPLYSSDHHRANIEPTVMQLLRDGYCMNSDKVEEVLDSFDDEQSKKCMCLILADAKKYSLGLICYYTFERMLIHLTRSYEEVAILGDAENARQKTILKKHLGEGLERNPKYTLCMTYCTPQVTIPAGHVGLLWGSTVEFYQSDKTVLRMNLEEGLRTGWLKPFNGKAVRLKMDICMPGKTVKAGQIVIVDIHGGVTLKCTDHGNLLIPPYGVNDPEWFDVL